ncbi:MAG: hypothetical protein EZS28_005414 [Streblomastix strix]|uniref:Uncharacterized protein n=1 Tax=Streblomastix strix TaxID=222440 RepID=A0A5J4WVN6_9EUKA|nr:MAG: hypothetical protein EZS28_005414 [Streblomastix strix]
MNIGGNSLSSPKGDYCRTFHSQTLVSIYNFEIAKQTARTGCSIEQPIPIGRPFENQESEPLSKYVVKMPMHCSHTFAKEYVSIQLRIILMLTTETRTVTQLTYL